MPAAAPPLVLHVVHHLPQGGLENGLANLVNHMPAYRHAIACMEDHAGLRERIRRPEVEVIALHRSRIGTWRLRAALHELCTRLRPAIVHTRNLAGLDALLPARLAGVRHTVHGEHGGDADDIGRRPWRPSLLRKAHSPLVARYVTASHHLQRYLATQVGIDPKRITRIHDGVDSARFSPAPASSKPLHLLPEPLRGARRLHVGTVGRVQPAQDQALLLRAVAALVAREPAQRARLLVSVVGDGPMLAELRALADQLGIADITWLPGAVGDVPQALRLFDVFVLPSLDEGVSGPLLEALATGLPVLASDVGGNPELVEAAVTGALFKPGDVQALAQLLERYQRDRTLRLRHGLAARESALRRFSVPAMVQQYQAVYDGLLG